MITVVGHDGEVTTVDAARLLGVSRPKLMEFIREGLLPAHQVGGNKRVAVADLELLANRRSVERAVAFAELRAITDQLGEE